MEDILLHVYSNLDIKDINNCLQVNRKYYRASRNAYLWLKLLERDYCNAYKTLLKVNHYMTYKTCYIMTKLKSKIKLNYTLNELSNLQRLYLSNNKLKTIPKELGQLSNLQQLNLYYNQLTTIPKELGQLSNLQILSLSYNKLTTIPKELEQLINLQIYK